jgi:hypothetical protein
MFGHDRHRESVRDRRECGPADVPRRRVQDAVWDPPGKRALFQGLDLKRPEILYLGAADGYEAMQLLATYPGGHAVLVDYDDFCRTDRFGKFPEAYPFLGHGRIAYREDMAIDFVNPAASRLSRRREIR